MAELSLFDKIRDYKHKLYLKKLYKGLLIGFSLFIAGFLTVNTLEFFGRFSTDVRTVMALSFLGFSGYILVAYILIPGYRLINLDKQLSDEDAAKQIGTYFQGIKDKLLNAIQLARNPNQSSLLEASLAQKSHEVSNYTFSEAVHFEENRKYLKYFAALAVLATGIVFTAPHFYTESTERLINFSTPYTPPAPFQFVLNNKTLQAFKNEDFTVQLTTEGNALPESAYVIVDGRKHKMSASAIPGQFEFTIQNLAQDVNFSFEASGFSSDNFLLKIVSRPGLAGFEANIKYPAYINKRPETIQNIGNLLVPEGSQITWSFKSEATDQLQFSLGEPPVIQMADKMETGLFKVSKTIYKSGPYSVNLKNEFANNKEEISFYVDVVQDQFPKISLEQQLDSSLNQFVILAGSISDDYGFTRLQLSYEVVNKRTNKSKKSSLRIPFRSQQPAQNFFFDWNIDSLSLQSDDELSYKVEVWDNDGVNGPKKSQSSTQTLKIPSKEEMKKELEQASNKAEAGLQENMQKAQQLNKELKSLKDKLKGKKQMTWQDKKQLEDILKKEEQLKKDLEELQKKMDENRKKEDMYMPQNDEVKQKMEALQKLMEEMFDPETKKLMEELQKLLEEKANPEQIQKTLEKLDKKQDNLNQELDRALELFKQLKLEQKMKETIEKLDILAEKQEKQGKETENTKDKKDTPEQKAERKDQQDQLNKMFEEVKDDVKKLEELNKSMDNPNKLEDTQQDQKEIDEDQDKSSDELEKGNKKQASKTQQSSSSKMKKMSKKMKEKMASMGMDQEQENIKDLRNILENILHLSFNQEDVMRELKRVNQLDPRYIELGQQQLKLKDDAVIIKDSLRALAKRVFQIQSFVTKELSLMEQYMEESVDGIKQRRPDIASGKGQLAMTSMNNLALLLNDALKQMQEEMKDGMGNPSSTCKNPKPGKGGKPKPMQSMSQMQSELNKKIDALKKSGKGGKELSEELAQLAQEQEALRKALKEMEKSMEKGDKNSGSMEELKNMMEKTEKDLVNKRINPETMMRNQQIITRLLESEKAQRERETDEQRKAETAKVTNRTIPPSLEKYLKSKEKQTELLRSVSPSFTLFYKQEATRYFQNIQQ